MTPLRVARWAALSSVLMAFFVMFCYLLFPASKIDILLARALAGPGLTITPAVHKTVLPGLAWDNLLLSSEQGSLLQCERLQIRPLLLPLFMGRAAVSGTATIGRGGLDINYAFNGADALDLKADGIDLADVPFFKNVLGATIAGKLWSRGMLKRGARGISGDLKFEVKQLDYSGIRLGAFQLPDASHLKLQGMIRVADGKARLESFTMEGDGLYMRLSGNLPGGAAALAPINLTLEIMPKPEFLEKQKLVFMLLAKFMTSPGVYAVPVKGTLLKPVIL